MNTGKMLLELLVLYLPQKEWTQGRRTKRYNRFLFDALSQNLSSESVESMKNL